MISKESQYETGQLIPSVANYSRLSPQNTNPLAGSLEEKARRLWEQRPAVSSEPPPRRRRYMRLRKLVYASRYDLPTLPERIATFAAENDLPMTVITLEAQAIMTEWQGASRVGAAMTNVELNQLKTRLYIALKPHLGDAKATEKAIATFAHGHSIPQDEVRRMADEQAAYREKFKSERSINGPATVWTTVATAYGRIARYDLLTGGAS